MVTLLGEFGAVRVASDYDRLMWSYSPTLAIPADELVPDRALQGDPDQAARGPLS